MYTPPHFEGVPNYEHGVWSKIGGGFEGSKMIQNTIQKSGPHLGTRNDAFRYSEKHRIAIIIMEVLQSLLQLPLLK